MNRFLCWFSCGAASAVAAKMTAEKYGEACSVVYCDTSRDEHPDNLRFLRDVEAWIGKTVTIIRSDKYASIDDVFAQTRYMAGVAGARCTTEMKKLPREAFQLETDTHVFGYTVEEAKRAEDFDERNPSTATEWILIDNQIDKPTCLKMLRDAGIALPVMYSLGFEHNNCLGCVKASSPGYWNRVRLLFPDVFTKRAEQSRALGCRLVRVMGKRVFLDELPEEETAPDDTVQCGPGCQLTLGDW